MVCGCWCGTTWNCDSENLCDSVECMSLYVKLCEQSLCCWTKIVCDSEIVHDSVCDYVRLTEIVWLSTVCHPTVSVTVWLRMALYDPLWEQGGLHCGGMSIGCQGRCQSEKLCGLLSVICVGRKLCGWLEMLVFSGVWETAVVVERQRDGDEGEKMEKGRGEESWKGRDRQEPQTESLKTLAACRLAQ